MLLAGAALTTTVFQDSKPVIARRAARVRGRLHPVLRAVVAARRSATTTRASTASRCRSSRSAAPTTTSRSSSASSRACAGWAARDRWSRSRASSTTSSPRFPDDIFTWTIVFLDSQMRGDAAATAKLQRMTSVAGGGEDVRRIDYTAPRAAAGDERIVIEFFHAGFGYYFVTADPAEAAGLDTGAGGWARTGPRRSRRSTRPRRRGCRTAASSASSATSRRTSTRSTPTSAPGLMTTPPWVFEKYAFRADFPIAEDCPRGPDARRARLQQLPGRGAQPPVHDERERGGVAGRRRVGRRRRGVLRAAVGAHRHEVGWRPDAMGTPGS